MEETNMVRVTKEKDKDGKIKETRGETLNETRGETLLETETESEEEKELFRRAKEKRQENVGWEETQEET